jgi:hypothetical protein
MIIGTVTLIMLLFGGGGTFSFEKAFDPFVKDAVKDESRYEQIADVTKQADENLKQFHTEVDDVWAKELKTLLGDYDASKDDFRSFVSRADQSRTAIQRELLDVRFKVTKLMTEDEWNSMYEAIEKKAEEEKKKAEDKGK